MQKKKVISNNDNNGNSKPKVSSTSYIQPSYNEIPPKMNINFLRCMGPGLYD
jgi:hypothetical protein